MNNSILIIDIETTGFLKAGGKIVEIGIVELNLQNGDTRIVFDEVMHERPITKEEVENSWIVKNSDLTVEEIRSSKQLKHHFAEVQSILNKYPLGCTAFNNAFDFGFMEDRGFKFPKKLPCPMKLATNVCKIPSKFGRGGYKWPNVEEAYKHFFGETNYIEKHRGADDAKHEAEIVHELYLQGVFTI
jgi:DNA polymerase-3 subunit epsilon